MFHASLSDLQRNIISRFYKILTTIDKSMIYSAVTRDWDELEDSSCVKGDEQIVVVLYYRKFAAESVSEFQIFIVYRTDHIVYHNQNQLKYITIYYI